MNIIFICIGGFIGASMRYVCSHFFSKYQTKEGFPWAILLINFIGSFLFGFFQPFSLSLHASDFFFIGVLGSFTTFSTFSLEALQLLQKNQINHFWFYISLSLLGSVAIYSLGLVFNYYFT